MFHPPLALASLSGMSDADWARTGAEYAGAAFLGGICLDDASRDAAREMVTDRDRIEFLPDEPLAFIDDQLRQLADAPIRPGFNVRCTTPGSIWPAAEICRDHDAIIEINAHCRQDELCAAGCGEALLADTDRLVSYVETAVRTGAIVSVKVRAEVSDVDLPETARRVAKAGADTIHVDAMDTEPAIREIAAAAPGLFLIANNGVRDRATAWEYFEYGADAVSVGRPSDDPVILAEVQRAVDEWHERQEATV